MITIIRIFCLVFNSYCTLCSWKWFQLFFLSAATTSVNSFSLLPQTDRIFINLHHTYTYFIFYTYDTIQLFCPFFLFGCCCSNKHAGMHQYTHSAARLDTLKQTHSIHIRHNEKQKKYFINRTKKWWWLTIIKDIPTRLSFLVVS